MERTLGVCVAVFFLGCATSGDDGGTADEARSPDSLELPNLPEAGRPDASPLAPDASPSTSDAGLPPPADAASRPEASSDAAADARACTPLVQGGVCNQFDQCGCKNGLNCDIMSTVGITSCEPAGNVPAFGACQSPSQCSVGTTCVDYACAPFCRSDPDCPAGHTCAQVYLSGVAVPGFTTCR